MLGNYLLLVLPCAVFACDTFCQWTKSPALYNGQVSFDVYGKPCLNWPVNNAGWLQSVTHNFCRIATTLGDPPMCYTNATYDKLTYCDVGSYECPLCANPPPSPPVSPILSLPCRLPPTPRTDPRIVGGRQVVNYEFQFFAAIAIPVGVNLYDECGGSLIHPYYVLTAAHCFTNNARAGTVSLGARALDIHLQPKDYQCWETHSFSAGQVYCHPSYNPTTKENDYCLIRLREASKYKPIKLWKPFSRFEENLEAEASMLTVIGTGWNVEPPPTGAQPTDDQWSGYLYKTYVPVKLQSLCLSKFAGYNTDSMLCAGYNGGEYDACQGDSGSPLFAHRQGDYWQVGVVSNGIGCARRLEPGLYARIRSNAFYNWVCKTPAPTRSPSTKSPTRAPSRRPTKFPTNRPTRRPTKSPATRGPTRFPTKRPTRAPSQTKPPTAFPTKKPTKLPTSRPTRHPTRNPTTKSPTPRPTTRQPTFGRPTGMPTSKPTHRPTKSPATRGPTRFPTHRPTKVPTIHPTTKFPTTKRPTPQPSTKAPTLPPLPNCIELFPPTFG